MMDIDLGMMVAMNNDILYFHLCCVIQQYCLEGHDGLCNMATNRKRNIWQMFIISLLDTFWITINCIQPDFDALLATVLPDIPERVFCVILLSTSTFGETLPSPDLHALVNPTDPEKERVNP